MANFCNILRKKKYSFSKIFKEPNAKPVIKRTEEEIKRRYAILRNSIFIAAYVIYASSYMCRKSIDIAIPFTNIKTKELGFITGVSSFVYGVGKFVNGIIADRGNVRISLPLNCIISAIFTGAMAFLLPSQVLSEKSGQRESYIFLICLIWSINSWFQSALFPYCTKTLVNWFPNKIRPKWWAIFSSSHELGQFIFLNISLAIGILTHNLLGFGGLESIFIFPFLFSLLFGVIGFFSLRDKPVTTGLPNVEEIFKNKTEKIKKNKSEKEKNEEENLTYFQTLKKYVIKNKVVWNLAAIYFCTYIFRLGPVTWIFKIISQPNIYENLEEKHLTFANVLEEPDKFLIKALITSILPLLGFFGTLFAPVLSEKVFKGKRVPANFWCLLIGAISLIGVWFGISSFSPIKYDLTKNILLGISLGVAGFSVCVPQVLVGGVCAIEFSSKKVAAAAIGFIGLIGYLGYAFGNFVVGGVLGFSTNKGTNGDSTPVLAFWFIMTIIGALLCIPIWKKE